MKNNLKILMFVLAIAFFSCNEEKDKRKNETNAETELLDHLDREQPDKAHTSENSLDWAGTYKGVIPCADCPGIEVSLQLKNNQTFALEMNYMERDSDFESIGKFEWSENGQIITLHPEEDQEALMKFFVGENVLFQVDEDGNRMDKEQEKNYTLMKEME